MWPFNRKSKQSEPDKLPVEIGKRFRYLGVDMICIRDFGYEYGYPAVVAEYVNKFGEIKQATFYPCDWVALEAELKNG